jgi:hypothetical protein
MEAAEQALALLKQSSEKSGLLLNTQKLEGPALDITAFNINLSENSIFITAPRIEELKNNYKNSAREKQREGIRSYIYSVNPSQALDLDY